MKNRIKILGIIVVLLIAAILGVWSHLKKEDAIVLLTGGETNVVDTTYISSDTVEGSSEITSVDTINPPDDTTSSGGNDEGIRYIAVHVCGCVNSPGVYTLEEGARITDAIAMADGFTDEADRNYLNLALVLADGVKVYVPSVSEVEELGGDESISLYTSQEVNQELGLPKVATPEDNLVNINTATKDELMSLPGVGESKAAAIIKYREESGGFGTISDIMNISGIKEGLFNKIKDKIKV